MVQGTVAVRREPPGRSEAKEAAEVAMVSSLSWMGAEGVIGKTNNGKGRSRSLRDDNKRAGDNGCRHYGDWSVIVPFYFGADEEPLGLKFAHHCFQSALVCSA